MYLNCSGVNGTAWPRFRGFLRIGQPDLIVENGSLRTPLGAAASTPTPAAPRPRFSITCMKRPPNEWPMMIGGSGRARIACS